MDNRISITIDPADITAWNTHLAALRAIAAKYAFGLTPEERQGTPTIGPKREAMVNTFDASMAASPALVPSYVSVPEKDKDSAAWKTTALWTSGLDEVREMVGDTNHLLGSELLANAYLPYYGNVQQAAKNGVPGADAKLAELKQFFPRGQRRPNGSGGSAAAAKA
jgi:hypothetical protein